MPIFQYNSNVDIVIGFSGKDSNAVGTIMVLCASEAIKIPISTLELLPQSDLMIGSV